MWKDATSNCLVSPFYWKTDVLRLLGHASWAINWIFGIIIQILLTCMSVLEVVTLRYQVFLALYSQINLSLWKVFKVLRLIKTLFVSQVEGVTMFSVCFDFIIRNSQTTVTFDLGRKFDLVASLRFFWNAMTSNQGRRIIFQFHVQLGKFLKVLLFRLLPFQNFFVVDWVLVAGLQKGWVHSQALYLDRLEMGSLFIC